MNGALLMLLIVSACFPGGRFVYAKFMAKKLAVNPKISTTAVTSVVIAVRRAGAGIRD